MVVRTVLVIGLLVAVLVAGVISVIAWLNRSQPGIFWFSVHAGLVTLWSLTALNSFIAESESMILTFGMLTSTLTFVVTISWFLFIINYLGYSNRPSPRAGLLFLFVFWVVYMLVYLTAPVTGLLEVGITEWQGTLVFDVELTLLRVAIVAFGLGLILYSLALLVRAAVIEDRLYRPQAVLLGIAVLIPLVNGLLSSLFPVLPTGVPTSQSTVVCSTVIYVFAFVRYDLFTLAPATERIGIRRAFESLGAGVIVSGPDGQILERNESAAEIVGEDGERLVGSQLATVFERLDVDAGNLPTTVQRANRWYWLSSAPITEATGTEIGRSVLLVDITDRRLQEQRLDVLDRILRHNLRNQLDVVRGQIEHLIRDVDDPAVRDSLTVVENATEDLLSCSDKARQFELAMQGGSERSTVDVEAMLERLVDELTTSREAVEFEVEPGLTVQTNLALVRLVCLNLIENAVTHNTSDEPRLTITGGRDAGAAQIQISDNGPGIPADELAAIEDGAETPLAHSSGLGLWIVTWATQRLGGSVDFTVTDNGTIVEVTVPDRTASPRAGQTVRPPSPNSE